MIKIVGQLVCGPNEKYLEETLQCFTKLCDDVVCATCNATQKEFNLLNKYDIRHYEDNREWGRKQPYVKTDLVRRILQLKPDWIIPLDADETMRVERVQLESLADGRESAHFYIVNLWNDQQHYSKTLSFWNVRFYKADDTKGVQFLRKPVHCGNAPPYFYCQPVKKTYVPYLVIHKGLMDKQDRLRKAERYAKYDPDCLCKGKEYYDALEADWQGSEFNESEVLTKIQNYVRNL